MKKMTLGDFYQEHWGSDPARFLESQWGKLANLATAANLVWDQCNITVSPFPRESLRHRGEALSYASKEDKGRVIVTVYTSEVLNRLNRTASERLLVPVVSFRNYRNSVNFEGKWNGYDALWDEFNNWRNGHPVSKPEQQDKFPHHVGLSTQDAKGQEVSLIACKAQFDGWPLMMPSEQFPYWSRKGLDGLHRVLPMRCGHARVRKGEDVECLAGWNRSKMDFVAIATTDIEKRFRGYTRIQADGGKFLPKGLNPLGSYVSIGNANRPTPKLLCEGVATGGALHKATGWRVEAALFADNLPAVAESFAQHAPDELCIVVADNDRYTPEYGNKGVHKACEAAAILNTRVLVPQFSTTEGRPTDGDDLYLMGGIDEVRRQLSEGTYLDTDFCQSVAGIFCLI